MNKEEEEGKKKKMVWIEVYSGQRNLAFWAKHHFFSVLLMLSIITTQQLLLCILGVILFSKINGYAF